MEITPDDLAEACPIEFNMLAECLDKNGTSGVDGPCKEMVTQFEACVDKFGRQVEELNSNCKNQVEAFRKALQKDDPNDDEAKKLLEDVWECSKKFGIAENE